MLDMNDRYKRNNNIIIKSLGGKQWALNMDNGGEYALNEVSYELLALLAIPHGIDALVSEIIANYDVSRKVLIDDCKVWLQIALEKELIEKV
jgi:hypothetical protein